MSRTIDELFLGADPPLDEEILDDGAFLKELFQSFLLCTRVSNTLPSGDDFAYKGTFEGVAEKTEHVGKQALAVLQQILDYTLRDGKDVIDLINCEDATDKDIFRSVADVVDGLLAEVDLYIEEKRGKGYRKQVSIMETQLNLKKVLAVEKSKEKGELYRIMAAGSSAIAKPQLSFFDEIDNSRERSFIPLLREKHYSLVPLYLTPVHCDGSENGGYPYYIPHPYQFEILNFVPTSWQLEVPNEKDLVQPQSLVKSAENFYPPGYTFIDDEHGLRIALATIEAHNELAIDLEAHNYRSFQGLLCLMQISTREADYIIDMLAVRSHLYLLRPLLANPNILKVFHGADSDILWLQRDVGGYVVNLFDTYIASKKLNFPSKSLAYLLYLYCGFESDKKHQLGDWRIRPISDEMLRYAQSDTHYLLYTYDRLRCQLGSSNAISEVIDESRKVCLKRYEKEGFNPNGWQRAVDKIYGKHSTQPIEIDEEHKLRLTALWDWRDSIARKEDDCADYVMSNYLLLRLAKNAPKNRDGLMRCANPLPPLVSYHADDILARLENPVNFLSDKSPAQIPVATIKAHISSRSEVHISSVGLEKYNLGLQKPGDMDVEKTSIERDFSEYRRENVSMDVVNLDEPLVFESKFARISPDNEDFATTVCSEHTMKFSNPSAVSISGGKIAARIRQEIAQEPLLSLQHVTEFVFEDSNTFDQNQMSDASIEQEGSELKVPEVDSAIPRSIQETYKNPRNNPKSQKPKKIAKDMETKLTFGLKLKREADEISKSSSDISCENTQGEHEFDYSQVAGVAGASTSSINTSNSNPFLASQPKIGHGQKNQGLRGRNTEKSTSIIGNVGGKGR